KGSENGERFEYAGRVLDPDGRPIAGAKLHLAYFGYRGEESPIRATTDAEGRFRFAMAKGDFSAAVVGEEPWAVAQVVAAAPGFGVGWTKPLDKGAQGDRQNLTIRLARDDVPIEGRIVDLQGHPVAGVSIRSQRILEPEHGDLSTWIAESKSGKEGTYET